MNSPTTPAVTPPDEIDGLPVVRPCNARALHVPCLVEQDDGGYFLHDPERPDRLITHGVMAP